MSLTLCASLRSSLRALLMAAFAVGVMSWPVAWAAPADTTAAKADNAGLTPQELYQFLLAEIAGQRGQLGLSASAFADLAKKTRNAGIARRAAEMSLHARQLDTALESVRLWNELAPDDVAARQTLANVLVATNRLDELSSALVTDLAAEAQPGPLLLRLNRLLARFPDKLAVQRLVEQVTVPYVSHPEAHFARAQAAAAARNPERAAVAIDEALRLKPDWELAAVFKAQIMERGPALVSFLRQFVTANTDAHEARLAYARALVSEKRYGDAREEFSRLLARFSDNPDIINAVGILSLQLDDAKSAETQFKRLLEVGKIDLNPVYFYLGQIAESDNRSAEALQHFDKVNGGEHQISALLRGTRLLSKEGRIDEARQRLQKARLLLPTESTKLLIAEAQLLHDAGRDQDAFAVLFAGLDTQPDNTDLLYEAALAAERLDKMNEAERYLRRLIALKPDSPQGYNALGYSLADRGLRLEEANQLIDKALSLAPDDPFILDSKGWVLFRLGQANSALDVLRRAYSKRPDPEIAAHIGEVLWALQRRDEAAQVWREAAKAFPSNAVLSATIKRYTP